ncbi:complement C1q tumor necrosis factor-related protein 7-like [Pecten maximus]|uniref:complement C1q tumor necrosis factor-related protein 7-like n=1 Tax=Pecten maximus TaxID=6579 RepID=UPI0014587528|nr:complement C1q tumor necrosis factor-related protein 7-like [Pecten maximus]
MIGSLARDRDDNERRLQAVEASARKQKSRLENELVSVQLELSTLQHKYQDLVSQIKTSSMKTVRTSDDAAASSLVASLSNRTSHLNHNAKIVMDHVLTNDGDSYNPQTGVFTCQQPGTYVFYITIQVEHGHRFGAEIVKNGEVIARVLAEPMYSRASSSTSVIVNLSVGDIVYVRSDGNFDNTTLQ